MIKEIVKDLEVLQQKSEKFEFGKDEYLIQDMIDTAEHYKERCIGLACIQIGTPKRIILVRIGNKFVPFINPIILQKSQAKYKTVEGCLSLEGEREVYRHQKIKVGYTTLNKKSKVEVFGGIIAEVIQHECDHLNGILI